jgi:hypothetical protein
VPFKIARLDAARRTSPVRNLTQSEAGRYTSSDDQQIARFIVPTAAHPRRITREKDLDV